MADMEGTDVFILHRAGELTHFSIFLVSVSTKILARVIAAALMRDIPHVAAQVLLTESPSRSALPIFISYMTSTGYHNPFFVPGEMPMFHK